MPQKPHVTPDQRRQPNQVGYRLHHVPAQVRLEREPVHDVPPADQRRETRLRHALGRALRDLVAVLFHIGHGRDPPANLAQAHAEIKGALVKGRHAHDDRRRAALDRHGEDGARGRVADEVADLD